MTVVGVVARTAVLLEAVALMCFVQYVEGFAQFLFADLAAVDVEAW